MPAKTAAGVARRAPTLTRSLARACGRRALIATRAAGALAHLVGREALALARIVSRAVRGLVRTFPIAGLRPRRCLRLRTKLRAQLEDGDEPGLTTEQQLLVEAYAMKDGSVDVPEAWRIGA